MAKPGIEMKEDLKVIIKLSEKLKTNVPFSQEVDCECIAILAQKILDRLESETDHQKTIAEEKAPS